jgi:hypothetical protein
LVALMSLLADALTGGCLIMSHSVGFSRLCTSYPFLLRREGRSDQVIIPDHCRGSDDSP